MSDEDKDKDSKGQEEAGQQQDRPADRNWRPGIEGQESSINKKFVEDTPLLF